MEARTILLASSLRDTARREVPRCGVSMSPRWLQQPGVLVRGLVAYGASFWQEARPFGLLVSQPRHSSGSLAYSMPVLALRFYKA